MNLDFDLADIKVGAVWAIVVAYCAMVVAAVIGSVVVVGRIALACL